MTYPVIESLVVAAYAVFDTEPHKMWDDFLFDLPSDQRSAVLIQTLNYQVENGGFAQWLNNGYGDAHAELCRVLRRIGTHTARNVDNLVLIATAANRQRPGDVDGSDLDAQDRAYYKLSAQFLADAEAYFAGLSAPTASDTHAELAALRDEVRRLREAVGKIVAISEDRQPGTYDDIMRIGRAALEVTK